MTTSVPRGGSTPGTPDFDASRLTEAAPGYRVPDSSRGLHDSGRPTVTIGAYPDYVSAQRTVDFLSDNEFPVEHVTIIGTDLRLVEKVLGRMTVGRAALMGAGSGAWLGLFIGLLLSLFTSGAWWVVVLAAVALGALWGAVFGATVHSLTGNQRDFTSASTLQARQYAVSVSVDYADRARELLTRMEPQPRTT